MIYDFDMGVISSKIVKDEGDFTRLARNSRMPANYQYYPPAGMNSSRDNF
jgi:hypothetical protein